MDDAEREARECECRNQLRELDELRGHVRENRDEHDGGAGATLADCGRNSLSGLVGAMVRTRRSAMVG